MVQRELKVDARCPACQSMGLMLRTMTQTMPYFGDVLLTTVQCDACGFKHSDTMVMTQRPPARHTLRVAEKQDLEARVVRSHSGTYRIPELGFAAEPGEGSESFVSNVEGVLGRVQEVLVRARLMFPDVARQARAEELLALLARMVQGEEPFTLVLEDPFGNSAILSERTQVEALTEAQASELRTGMTILDVEDLQG
ncbi:MAG: ZPR1 zinc finger domain-containing protein [Halobacteriales archaeon]|nr:ZPR1 zinc finger domain-containing protein [Halobacteriales archaeon]